LPKNRELKKKGGSEEKPAGRKFESVRHGTKKAIPKEENERGKTSIGVNVSAGSRNLKCGGGGQQPEFHTRKRHGIRGERI